MIIAVNWTGVYMVDDQEQVKTLSFIEGNDSSRSTKENRRLVFGLRKGSHFCGVSSCVGNFYEIILLLLDDLSHKIS